MTGTPRLGFIGLGHMGGAMAHRLLKQGLPLTVWARNKDRLPPFLAAGAKEAGSPAELARDCDVIFTCVFNTAALEDLLFGDGRLVDGLADGKMLVDFSTADPETSRRIAHLLRADHGTGMIDAPVSGGPPSAETGTLVIMAGGSDEDFAAVRGVIEENLAGRLTLMGPSGAGQATKLINQTFVGNLLAVLAEAAKLATNAGIEADRIPAALQGGRADSRLLQEWFNVMLEGKFLPGGAISTIEKDLDAVLALAKNTRTPMPMTATAAQLHRMMTARGHADEDVTAIYKLYGDDPLPWK